MSRLELPLIGPDAHTEEWLACRVFRADSDPCIRFGASQAGQLCGLNPYQSEADLFLQAMGVVPREIPETVPMRLGKLLEPAVMQEYTNRTGNQCTVDHPMYFHYKHRFLAATPDGMTTEDGERIVVDGKTSTWHMFDKSESADLNRFGADGTDEIPATYFLQAQQQMLVMGCRLAHYPTLFDGRTMRIYRIERNDEMCDMIIERATKMIERFKTNECPDINPWHRNVKTTLFNRWQLDDPATAYEMSDEEELKWFEHAAHAEQAKAVLDKFDAFKAELQDRMGTATLAHFNNVLDKQLKLINIKEQVFTEADFTGIELYRLVTSMIKGEKFTKSKLIGVANRFYEEVMAKIGQKKKSGSRYLREVKRKDK